MIIYTYSYKALAGAQLGGGGDLPYLFLKIKKKCPDFRKKGPHCDHLCVKFAI